MATVHEAPTLVVVTKHTKAGRICIEGARFPATRVPRTRTAPTMLGIRRRAHSVVRPRFRIGCRPT